MTDRKHHEEKILCNPPASCGRYSDGSSPRAPAPTLCAFVVTQAAKCPVQIKGASFCGGAVPSLEVAQPVGHNINDCCHSPDHDTGGEQDDPLLGVIKSQSEVAQDSSRIAL